MDDIWALVCLGVLFSAQTGSTQDARTLFVLTGPEVLPAGTPSVLAVTVVSDLPVRVKAEVSHHNNKVTQTQDFQGGVTKLLTLPPLPVSITENSHLNLTVTGYNGDNIVFTNITSVSFDPRNVSCFLQTERSQYRPGDAVKVWAACLQLDNRPYKGKMDISMKNPTGNVVDRWQSTGNHGIVFQEFHLSLTPPLGKWAVTLTVQDVTDERTFTVEHDEPPHFDVLLKTSPQVLIGEDISGSVRAIYPSRQPVQGTLNVSLTQLSGVDGLTQTEEIYGSAQFFFSKSQLRSLDASSMDVLHITACITERSTGIKVCRSVAVHLMRNSFQLKFRDFPQSLKPSLTFFTKLSISRYDRKPLSPLDQMNSVVVDVTQTTSTMKTETTTMTLPVPGDGNIHIQFKLQDEVKVLLIQAKFQSSVETLKLYKNYSSPSGSYLLISPSLPAKVGLALQLDVESTFEPTKLHYVVTSRGQVVTAGTKTSSSFSLVPTLSWSPEACITVYSILSDGELISDTAQIPVNQQGYVSLNWSSDKAQPGEQVVLTVTDHKQNSHVGILVTAIHDDAPQDCWDFKTRQGCKIKMLSNARLHKENQMVDGSENVRDALLVEKYWTHWVDRSQPILWFDAALSNKTWRGDITVPDDVTCLAATALAMSDDLGLSFTSVPQKLMVSKDFSLSLNVPSYLIRGEELVMEVNIINHLERDLEVMLLLSQSEAFEFVLRKRGDIAMVNAHTFILKGYASATALFPIRPVAVGEMEISVDAISADSSDSLVWRVIVKPEGFEQYFSETLFLEVAPHTHNNSKSISVSLPPDVVQDSQRVNVVLMGDILALSIKHLDSLVEIPIGCGEQNMIHFAPSIYVLQYLDRSSQDHPEIRKRVLGYMVEGYQKQLSYQRDDGSFSAFGASDTAGSTWLTAYVLKCFLQAQRYMQIDQSILDRAKNWLLDHQGPQGEFPEVGTLMHTEMQGGLDNSPVALTAYVMMALLENKTYVEMYLKNMLMMQTYLEGHVTNGTLSNYTLCLAAYALALAKSPVAGIALTELSRRADYRGDVMMWASSAGLESYEGQPRSSQVEMASYVMLAHIQRGSFPDGIPLMKWLSRQRNHLGGYGSTQDTVIALQALANYAAFSGANALDLHLQVSAPASSYMFSINSTSYLTYQQQEIKAKQDIHLNVYMEGRGFAIFQMNVFYNLESKTISPKREKEAFELNVNVSDDRDHNHLLLSVCVSLKKSQVIAHTGMVILDVGMLSGFALSPVAAVPVHPIRKVETLPQRVYLYLHSLNKSEVCIQIPLIRMFKVAHIQDALVQVYDYYEPTRRAETTYNSDVLRHMEPCVFCGEDCHLCRTGIPIVVSSLSAHAIRSSASSLCWLLVGLITGYFFIIVV
uniref:CD109 antigen-like isoform X2 n=1 Tax=Doryrhamphus excisus TaxID=161450 RepID=UPI0025AEC8E1|nr:CD109 antigen-like isoform X2 [Doryrhamphus excisus]